MKKEIKRLTKQGAYLQHLMGVFKMCIKSNLLKDDGYEYFEANNRLLFSIDKDGGLFILNYSFGEEIQEMFDNEKYLPDIFNLLLLFNNIFEDYTISSVKFNYEPNLFKNRLKENELHFLD